MCCLIHFRQRLSLRNCGKPFQGRDEAALRSILTVLLTRRFPNRFVSSDALFNDPSGLPLAEQEWLPRSRFEPGDLIIRTTRFGMDDWHVRHARRRRKVEMSGNYLERCFVSDWRQHFSHLSCCWIHHITLISSGFQGWGNRTKKALRSMNAQIEFSIEVMLRLSNPSGIASPCII